MTPHGYSDFLVALSIPLLSPELDWQMIWKLFSPVPVSDAPFSLESAYRSYINYGSLASAEAGRMRRSHARLGRSDLRLSAAIGEGKAERDAFFSPILEYMLSANQRAQKARVLLPGCGLGRLAWDLSEKGFDVYALELSYFQTLALRFLSDPTATSQPDQHSIHPYAYWFSHQKDNNNLFRSVSFPDVVPRFEEGKFTLIEEDFLRHSPPWSKQGQSFWDATSQSGDGYDYIVTLFFIDTSLNIFSTLHKIYALLKPGGIWINLGPLLWTGNAQAKLELSLTGKSEYTADREAMMRWIYKAEFWVAEKPQ
ncbi:N2227-domain-containing protein [Flagelloscypha sp. PMI_526]|nr:N2227-domain-containing protein [Flagelloscypha sp. PMI_526]